MFKIRAKKTTEALKYVYVIMQLENKRLEYIKSVLNYWRFRTKNFPEVVVKLRGLRFLARKNGMDIAHLSWLYEPETTKFMIKLKPKLFLNVGAHIGRYSILLASAGTKVVAIEPSKYNFASLLQNIKLNGLGEKIKALNIGCLDKNCRKILFFSLANEGTSSFLKSSGSLEEECVVEKLDTVARNQQILPQEIDVIKIDVEGTELQVLIGAKDILEKGKPILVIETLQQSDFEKIQTFLKGFGYVCEKLLDGRNFIFTKSRSDGAAQI